MTAMQLTDEQRQVIDSFVAGKRLAVEAGAGCGKTSALVECARTTSKIGTFIAFNRAIVADARAKLPMTCQASTAHSLAMGAVGRQYAHRLEQGRMRSWDMARLMDVPNKLIVEVDAGKQKVLAGGYLASIVMRGIQTFCQSADPAPVGAHLPFIHAIDRPGRHTNNDLLRVELEPAMQRAWADLSNVDGKLRFDHSCYLKIWSLSRPTIAGEYLLWDEAQDASPVMMAAVASSMEQTGQQVCWIGDANQSIYGWAGAVNAMALADVDERCMLSQSFRFGQPIADVANVVLTALRSDLRLTGSPNLSSTVGPVSEPDVVLCRSNACTISTFLGFQRQGRKAHIVGGAVDLLRFARAAIDLEAGRKTFHPELACFDTWREVQEYCEADELGGELALMVHLIDEYGAQIVIDALEGMPAENAADVLVSTAHKAKGREWPMVRLASDFAEPNDMGAERDAEYRLLYVSATRAMDTLDLRMCLPLAELNGGRRSVFAW